MEDENKVIAEISAKITLAQNYELDVQTCILGSEKKLQLTLAMITAALIDNGFPEESIKAAVLYGIQNSEELASNRIKQEES